MKPPAFDPMTNRFRGQSPPEQLPPCDDAMLARDQSPELAIARLLV
jgi:hypothetical protein